MEPTIPFFPARMDEIALDRSNSRLCQVCGLYQETAQVRGQARVFLTYLPEGLESDRNVLIVAPPANCDVAAFLESSGLRALANAKKFFLHILIPENSRWDTDGLDAEYFQAVFDASVSRRYYVTMVKQDNFYALGFEDGCDIALQAVTMRPVERQAADGRTLPPLSPKSDLFSALGLVGTPTERGMRFWDDAQCETPVWIFGAETPETERCLDYWRDKNHCLDTVWSGDGADRVYAPSPVRTRSEVNRESIAQVRFTAGEQADLDRLTNFLFSFRHHVSYGHRKDLRYYKDPQTMGATLHTLMVDGWGRRWYEYVPESVCNSKEPVPLVLTLHARGMDAAGFFDLSGMSCVAEERGFICCFPESGVYQQRPGGLASIPLWSGFYKDEPFDDIHFLREMIDDVCSRLPIDRSRIYACGQSSGGMMCSELAWYASDLFAAVACWSGMWMEKEQHIQRTPSTAPIPVMFLYGDSDWLVASKSPDPELPFAVGAEMRPRVIELMKRYQLNDPPAHYRCAPIDYYIYENAHHVPMLTVGVVSDMPHCNYPEQSWISWDQLFCKFRRNPDGSIAYMGKTMPL